VARRHTVFSMEEILTRRLHAYGRALEQNGRSVTLSGLVEAALCEYLDRRCALDGMPFEGSDPAPVIRYAGRGRPSRLVLAARYQPLIERTAGGRRPR